MLRDRFPAKTQPFHRVFTSKHVRHSQRPGWVVLKDDYLDASEMSAVEILSHAERSENGIAIFIDSMSELNKDPTFKQALDTDFWLDYQGPCHGCYLKFEPGYAELEREKEVTRAARAMARSEFVNKNAVYAWEFGSCANQLRYAIEKRFPKLNGCLTERLDRRTAWGQIEACIKFIRLYKWLKPKSWRKDIFKDADRLLRVTERLKNRKTGAWARKRLRRYSNIETLIKALPPLPKKKKTRRKKS